MDSIARLTDFFWAIAVQFPSLITIVVCLIVVAKRGRKYPKVSLPALIGLILLFLTGLVFAGVFTWVPALLPGSPNPDTIHNLYLVLSVLNYGAVAIAFVPLLVAIFIRRNPA